MNSIFVYEPLVNGSYKPMVVKKLRINWIEGVKLDADEDGFIEIRWEDKYKDVSISSVKRYYNCLYLLAKLSPCARNLMDYLSEVMDSKNLIRSSEHDRSQFIQFIDNITNGDVTYGHQAVKNAYGELAEKNLLLHKQKGLYKVNELYFFSGSEVKRLTCIKLSIQIGNCDTFKFLTDKKITL